jgi:acetyl-CoA acetyltransferase
MTRHHPMRNAAAVIAMGTKLVTKDDPKITSLQLQLDACLQAIEKSGLHKHQIGAVFTCRAPMGYTALQWNLRIVQELKIVPMLTTEITVHGAGVLATLAHAAMAVQSGVVDYALCCSGCTGPLWTDMVKVNASIESDLQFEAPFGPTTPALYAQWAQRYMYEFDVRPEDLAIIAVENRKWALKHPGAVMRSKGPITVEDVLASKMLASPIRMLDSSAWYKGGFGTAVIVTRADNVPADSKPIYITGFGEGTTHEWITDRMHLSGVSPAEVPNLTTTGAKVAAERAYAMAGLGPRDMSMVETSVPFTFANMMVLEDLGFCKKGEGKHFVRDGGISYETGLPFNTNGGYLSFGQPPHGMHMAVEAIEQLRGEAQGKQVKDPRHALVHFHGGPLATHCVMVLSNERNL